MEHTCSVDLYIWGRGGLRLPDLRNGARYKLMI